MSIDESMEKRLARVEHRLTRLHRVAWGLAAYAFVATGILFYRGGFFGRPLVVDSVQAERVEAQELVALNKDTRKPTATISGERLNGLDHLVIRGPGGRIQMSNFDTWAGWSTHRIKNDGQEDIQTFTTNEAVGKLIHDAQMRMRLELQGLPR